MNQNNTAVTKSEATFLLARKCRIFLVYNATNSSSVKGGRPLGNSDARNAIAFAADAQRALGVPNRVWIYANIEPGWTTSADWILGWWDTMLNSRYGGVGGFYCNTDNPFAFNNAYCAALKKTAIPKLQDHSNLYSQHPHLKCGEDVNQMAFTPKEPPCHTGGSVIWQYATDCASLKTASIDFDVANDRGFDSRWKP
jgi:hypothetical protein